MSHPQKQALATAYATKRMAMKKRMSKGGGMSNCGTCGEAPCVCMAEGGMVDDMRPLQSKAPEHNEELDMVGSPSDMPSLQTESSEMDSDMEKDLPEMIESISLAADVMKDRKRRMMSEGGEVDAPKEDGRSDRGLNLEPVHTMSDEEHDTSDASLVSSIIRDRKMRRRG